MRKGLTRLIVMGLIMSVMVGTSATTTANAFTYDGKINKEIGLGLGYYQWEEFNSAVKIDGYLAELTGKVELSEYSLSGEKIKGYSIFEGNLYTTLAATYDGVLWDGTAYKADASKTGLKMRIGTGIGMQVNKITNLSVFPLIQYDTWTRDVEGGYSEDWNDTSAGIGIKILSNDNDSIFRQDDKYSYATFEFMKSLNTENKAEIIPYTLKPKNGKTFEIKAGIKKGNIVFEATIMRRSWDSSDVVDGYYQPDSSETRIDFTISQSF